MIFLVAVSLVAVMVELPGVVAERGRAASGNSALSFADREVAGGNDVVPDQSVLYEARARIPLDARYKVVVGSGYQGGSELTAPYVASFFTYFLMPRRPAENAEWIVCFGCELGDGLRAGKVVWRGPEDASIVKVAP
ncbi:MAG: hypothetical protein RMM28_09720 [Thermoleophilia bacterium]|nr:hypothetical protein [Gaiellaceae bacterium]MDW8339402.1 hypothetical protein [Thermoleophilia bacterium]